MNHWILTKKVKPITKTINGLLTNSKPQFRLDNQ